MEGFHLVVFGETQIRQLILIKLPTDSRLQSLGIASPWHLQPEQLIVPHVNLQSADSESISSALIPVAFPMELWHDPCWKPKGEHEAEV